MEEAVNEALRAYCINPDELHEIQNEEPDVKKSFEQYFRELKPTDLKKLV